MPRRSQFTVSAESVQGNEGATVTFSCLKVREVREYREQDDLDDREMLKRHVIKWSGIVDDSGNELPSPRDEPDILGELYVHEQRALTRLMWAGPDGPEAKN